MRRHFVGSVLLAVFAAACGQITVSEPRRANSTGGSTADTIHAGAERAFDEDDCDFETGVDPESAIEVTCGSLAVPIDRAEPATTTDLAVAIYSDPTVAEPIPTIYLHGGPGSGGVLVDLATSFDQVSYTLPLPAYLTKTSSITV